DVRGVAIDQLGGGSGACEGGGSDGRSGDSGEAAHTLRIDVSLAFSSPERGTLGTLQPVVRRLTLIALAAALVASATAGASDRLDVNATNVRLAVNKSGIALVTYRARSRT